MIRHIALALTVAAITTSAAAQSNRKQPTWDDLLKPIDVKTNPAVPIAPTGPAPAVPEVRYAPTPAPTPVQPAAPAATDRYDFAKISNTPPETIPTGLLDACIIEATGRLPKVDGLRVTDSSYEFDYSQGRYDQYWRVSISVKLGDRQARYSWDCRIDTRGTARLK